MIAWNFQRIVGTCQFRVPWFGYPCGYSSLTIYAKQFAEEGNLKGIGDWYDYVGATAGDYVKVVFTSQNYIIIEHSIDRFSFHI